VETEFRGDEAVIEIALQRSAAVVTNDRELIQRLKQRRVLVVRLRSERYLVADDY
jgi:rRNA-processing protein FCF1